MSQQLNIYSPESQLHSSNIDAIVQLPQHAESWIILSLLFLFFLSFRYIRHFMQIALPEMIHFHIAQKHFEESSVLIAYIRQFLFLLSMALASFFFFVIIKYETTVINNEWDEIRTYLIILAILLALYFLKSLVLYFVAFLSNTKNTMRMIRYYAQIYIIIGGLILLPSIVLYFNFENPLYNILLISELSICAFLFLLYFFRTLQIFIASGLSIFLWLLYLCTLEIVPYLIIYKFFTTN